MLLKFKSKILVVVAFTSALTLMDPSLRAAAECKVCSSECSDGACCTVAESGAHECTDNGNWCSLKQNNCS